MGMALGTWPSAQCKEEALSQAQANAFRRGARSATRVAAKAARPGTASVDVLVHDYTRGSIVIPLSKT